MINFRNFKHIFAIIVLSLGLIFGLMWILSREFLVPLNYFLTYRTGEDTWQDKIYKIQSKPSDDIVIVEIDEKTINTLNARNETQSLGIAKSDYQKVTERLLNAGVKSIGYDIIFQNRDDSGEQEFADLLKKFQNVVIGVQNLQKDGSTSGCEKDEDSDIITCQWTPRSLYASAHWWSISIGNNKKSESTPESRSNGFNILENNEQKKAKFWEKNNISLWNGKIWSLPIAMLSSVEDEKYSQILKKITQKTDIQMMQPFFGNSFKESTKNTVQHGLGIYRTISFIDILESFSLEWLDLKGKFVFIGESGDLLHDRFISPSSGYLTPGVYSHAFFLDNLLQNKILEKADTSVIFSIIIVLTLTTVLAYFFLPKYISPFLFLFSIFLSIWTTRYFYDSKNLVIDIFPLLISSSIITYPTTYIYKFFIIEKDKRLILNNFSRYLSPSVVKMIDANNIEMTLGGEKKELSIFFSDIAGFTTISEKLDTKDLFVLMTKYLSKMTGILTQHKGTLDKYIGDAVMWFFGAPVDDDFHAINACKTAIHMRKALKEINEEITKNGGDPIDFRVGIATGEVLVGNIWSENRFNYTVLGDIVNLASRLEATGKEYHVNVIIAASTRSAIGNYFLVRELDYIAVKWKHVGTRIFELIGMAGDNIDMWKYQTYETALSLYRAGKYLEAGKIFEKNMEIDPPSKIMAYRCVDLLQGKTTLDNGIYRMTHK